MLALISRFQVYSMLGWKLYKREPSLLEAVRLDALPAPGETCANCKGPLACTQDTPVAHVHSFDDGASASSCPASAQREGVPSGVFRCDDCRFGVFCGACIGDVHKYTPFHNIEARRVVPAQPSTTDVKVASARTVYSGSGFTTRRTLQLRCNCCTHPMSGASRAKQYTTSLSCTPTARTRSQSTSVVAHAAYWSIIIHNFFAHDSGLRRLASPSRRRRLSVWTSSLGCRCWEG